MSTSHTPDTPTVSAYRLAILEKMADYERRGWFDRDLEEDPPGKELHPEDINYIKKGPLEAIKRFITFRLAYAFFRKQQREGNATVRGFIGAEKLGQIEGGCVITCNHFHPFDSFLMQLVFDESKRAKRMYRIISEANYTGFPGFYGRMMRHCDTLPLSSNMATMRKFVRATSELLADGNCILVYPEQSLWWHYRKPKPMKLGAFEIAVKSNVPVVPCFITMENCDKLDADGLPTQAYTMHIGDPIYPDHTLGKRERAERMREQNTDFCKQTYESFYNTPLTYTTESEQV